LCDSAAFFLCGRGFPFLLCVGWDGNKDPLSIVDRAIARGANKVQLFKPCFNEDSVKKAHAHGIRCNVFYADDPEEARHYLAVGIDTVLTNDSLAVYNRVRERLPSGGGADPMRNEP